jgi:hypothetical protein
LRSKFWLIGDWSIASDCFSVTSGVSEDSALGSTILGPILQYYTGLPAVFDDFKLEALFFSWAAEAKF